MQMSRCFAAATALVLAGFALGCEPLEEQPELRGPSSRRGSTQSMQAAQELVWFRGRSMIRITRTAKMCQEEESGPGSGSCVVLADEDRKQIDRFFGGENFRSRWDNYRPCQARIANGDSEIFAVTFADGHKVGKLLDAPMGSPATRVGCDREIRDGVSTLGEDLAKRYFQ